MNNCGRVNERGGASRFLICIAKQTVASFTEKVASEDGWERAHQWGEVLELPGELGGLAESHTGHSPSGNSQGIGSLGYTLP